MPEAKRGTRKAPNCAGKSSCEPRIATQAVLTPHTCVPATHTQALGALFEGWPRAVTQMVRYAPPEAVLESGVHVRRCANTAWVWAWTSVRGSNPTPQPLVVRCHDTVHACNKWCASLLVHVRSPAEMPQSMGKGRVAILGEAAHPLRWAFLPS